MNFYKVKYSVYEMDRRLNSYYKETAAYIQAANESDAVVKVMVRVSDDDKLALDRIIDCHRA